MPRPTVRPLRIFGMDQNTPASLFLHSMTCGPPHVTFPFHLQPSSTTQPSVSTMHRLLDEAPTAGGRPPAHLLPRAPSPCSCVAPAGTAVFVPLFGPELEARGSRRRRGRPATWPGGPACAPGGSRSAQWHGAGPRGGGQRQARLNGSLADVATPRSLAAW
jgi:hypothetical protein